MKDNKETQNISTSEKPVSLSPLNLKEALVGLLKVKPKKEEETKDQGEKEKEKPSD